MNKLTLFAIACLTTGFISANSHAFELTHPVSASIIAQSSGLHTSFTPVKREVYLMGINLTSDEQHSIEKLKQQMDLQVDTLQNVKFQAASLAASVNIGMNGVSVLDQGQHGTCATFANTALVDATLGKGDYISQLCQLELGTTLEKEGYIASGWDGSLGPYVLDQMFRFGVISKSNQQRQSCAGMKDYPGNNPVSHGNPMSVDDYKFMSEDLFSKNIFPEYLLNFNERFYSAIGYSAADASANLLKVKQALARGDRASFGVMLASAPASCSAGACAKYHATNDTWALTQEVNTMQILGGHEMVIFGYDDNAIAIDPQGKQHRGLLMLRNSWGSLAGDAGNYYMTYDYFKTLTGEIQLLAHRKA